MILFYIGFFGWIVIIAATIFLNWYRITKLHSTPHYFGSNWSRGIFGFACLVLMTTDSGFDPWYWHTWILIIPHVVYIWSAFYLFFDPGLNLSRKKDIDYRGKKSGWLDPVLTKTMWWVLKGVSLIALMWSIKIIWSL